ncbi:unnamed protein product [Pseudo-nitzschia multistriata]|nr:unnamed protein product [Pseudo-nitzschia multistriata]
MNALAFQLQKNNNSISKKRTSASSDLIHVSDDRLQSEPFSKHGPSIENHNYHRRSHCHTVSATSAATFDRPLSVVAGSTNHPIQGDTKSKPTIYKKTAKIKTTDWPENTRWQDGRRFRIRMYEPIQLRKTKRSLTRRTRKTKADARRTFDNRKTTRAMVAKAKRLTRSSSKKT